MEMHFGFYYYTSCVQTKTQGDKALKGSDSKLGPILPWALWCFEESMHLKTIDRHVWGSGPWYSLIIKRLRVRVPLFPMSCVLG